MRQGVRIMSNDERYCRKFVDEFGADSIRFVTVDREFCSKEWLAYLIENKIAFRLRIKANHQITNARGELIKASRVMSNIEDRRTT